MFVIVECLFVFVYFLSLNVGELVEYMRVDLVVLGCLVRLNKLLLCIGLLDFGIFGIHLGKSFSIL